MILWAIFYREAFGLEIYLDVTLIRTICLTIVTDQEIVFPDGCGPFEQDNASYHKAKNALW